jgi:hypothetical protein
MFPRSQAALFAFLTFAATSAHSALDVLPLGHITLVENGWFGEGLALHLDVSTPNNTCPAAANDFGIPKEHPSYKDLVAIALSAHAIGAAVQLGVDQGNCVFGGRTRVISIRSIK